tara:strand:+ start:2420 stop:2884 length:465 start_codon:yes stop_codon:yes gene_type:complete
MGIRVEVDVDFDDFERSVFRQIGLEMEASQNLFSASVRTALQSAGRGSKRPPVHSPDGSNLPYVISGDLARSWGNVTPIRRQGGKFVGSIYTTLDYALYLLTRTPKTKKNGAMSKSGRRDYMDKNLYWWNRMLLEVKKRFDADRLFTAAARSMK